MLRGDKLVNLSKKLTCITFAYFLVEQTVITVLINLILQRNSLNHWYHYFSFFDLFMNGQNNDEYRDYYLGMVKIP